MNKRGDEILSIWWFFILAVIGVGIVLGVLRFYSIYADVREVDADILGNRIYDCIVSQGQLRNDFRDFNIFSECKLNKEVLDSSGDYFINVSIYDPNDKLARPEITAGVLSFQITCDVNAKSYARCSEKNVYAFLNDKRYLIKILTGSNNAGERL